MAKENIIFNVEEISIAPSKNYCKTIVVDALMNDNQKEEFLTNINMDLIINIFGEEALLSSMDFDKIREYYETNVIDNGTSS